MKRDGALDRLEELARKATPGPWHWEYGVSQRTTWALVKSGNTFEDDEYLMRWEGPQDITTCPDPEPVMDFIEAATPDVVLRLITATRTAFLAGAAGQHEAATDGTSEALAWFGEPRYSVTDLQRAYADGEAASVRSALPQPLAGPGVPDVDRLCEEVVRAGERFVATGGGGMTDEARQAYEDLLTARAALLAALHSETTPAGVLDEAGTTTDCPLEGVHEHAFRGPHRFREWDPANFAALPQPGEPTP